MMSMPDSYFSNGAHAINAAVSDVLLCSSHCMQDHSMMCIRFRHLDMILLSRVEWLLKYAQDQLT